MIWLKAGGVETNAINGVLRVMKVSLKRLRSASPAVGFDIVPYQGADFHGAEESAGIISKDLKTLRTMTMELEAVLVYRHICWEIYFVFKRVIPLV